MSVINSISVMAIPGTATPSTLSTLMLSMLVSEVACIVRVLSTAVPSSPLAMDRREAVESKGDQPNDIDALIVDGSIETVTKAPQLWKGAFTNDATFEKFRGVPRMETSADAPANMNAQSVALAILPARVMLVIDGQL